MHKLHTYITIIKINESGREVSSDTVCVIVQLYTKLRKSSQSTCVIYHRYTRVANWVTQEPNSSDEHLVRKLHLEALKQHCIEQSLKR